MTKPRVSLYLASPLGFADNGDYRQRVKKAIHRAFRCDCPDYKLEITDPWDADHSEVFRSGQSPDSKAYSVGWYNYVQLKQAHICFGICDGSDVDSGTASEMGFAAGNGAHIYGLRTDFRNLGDIPGTAINLQVQFWIDWRHGKLFRSLDEITFKGFLKP